MVSDKCKSCTKWSYIVLAILTFFLGFVALAPLYTWKQDDSDDAKVTGFNILTQLPCVKNCPEGTIENMKEAGTYKGLLYIHHWNGWTESGHDFTGMKHMCKMNKFIGDEACNESEDCQAAMMQDQCDSVNLDNGYMSGQIGCDAQCELFFARFASSAVWAASQAMLGIAAVIAILTILTACCNCMKGCANKMLRILCGIFLFLGGMFSAAAVGNVDVNGIPKDVTCYGENKDMFTNDAGCLKRSGGFFAYVILVVVVAWIAAFCAFGAACCCNPDKRSDEE